MNLWWEHSRNFFLSENVDYFGPKQFLRNDTLVIGKKCLEISKEKESTPDHLSEQGSQAVIYIGTREDLFQIQN